MNAIILLFSIIAPDVVWTQFYNYASVITPYGTAHRTPKTRMAPGVVGSVRYFGGGYQHPMPQWGGRVYGRRPSSPYGGSGGGGGGGGGLLGGTYGRPPPPLPRPDTFNSYGNRPNPPHLSYTGRSNYGVYGGRPDDIVNQGGGDGYSQGGNYGNYNYGDYSDYNTNPYDANYGRPGPNDNGNPEDWSFMGSLFGDYGNPSETSQNYGEPQVVTIDLGALWSAIKPHLINLASEHGLWNEETTDPTKPAVTAKPTTQRVTTQRPTTQPPRTKPPTTQPPTTRPPTTQPSTTQPPPTLPPTTTPTTEPTTTSAPQTDSSSSQARTAAPGAPVFYDYGDIGLQYTVFQCRFYLIDKNVPLSPQTDESNRIYLNVQPPNGDRFRMYVNPVNGFPEPDQELPDGRPLPDIDGQPCENDGKKLKI